MKERVLNILKNFNLAGKLTSIKAFGNGHINKTLLVKTTEDEYILQKINNYAFKDVDLLMNNMDVVTSFIKEQGYETIDIVHAKSGKLYVLDNNDYFRMFRFIKNSKTYETVGNDLSLASALGEAFGNLHHLLANLDADELGETIPDFHNTPKRFSNFCNAYLKSDLSLRKQAREEIDYILDQNGSYSGVVDGLRNGEIKNHITHNDPKINNVLFDETTNRIRCVIDLDTVMPGSVLYDIGDSFRSLFTGENEDNPDLSLQKVRIDVFKAYMTAYLKEMKDDLTEKEIELIPYSIYLMTIECGMRFLEDYLRGNVYFHVDYEEHNLVRARTQIALAKDIQKNKKELIKIVNEIVGK